ncbi:MAG: tRNA (adenosine(37)-N6)-threonylcarbamoyltransferase complex transferase subunit TsaD [Clostridiales bacterium]|nr:tRNA (adenosine(37)-N6)-threonylcarbamoyltransferase complex transferase subunit TsaD [Clostridiales bacterium]
MEEKEKIVILAIESSCDETSAAVVVNGREVLSNVISSQIKIHKLFGGVVPEIASRKHIENIDGVVEKALNEAGVGFKDLTAVAVTYGPGLVGALLVGVSYAKSLAFGLDLPLIPVHHIEGHIAANYIQYPNLEPPFICLVVSGGHTNLVKINSYNDFDILGHTRDDAAGEAYDKVARSLNLPYPGGPKIDLISKEGNSKSVRFPRVMLEEGSYDFSFSGLKSAVLNHLNKCRMQGSEYKAADIAASFQQAVVEVLTEKSIRACCEYGIMKLAACGGVSANSALRASLENACSEKGIEFFVPRPVLCTDNGAMIGSAAYYEYRAGCRGDMSLNAVPSLKLGERRY